MTPGTIAHQAHLSMGFPRQQYWSGLPCPSPGDLSNPGIELMSPVWQVDPFNPGPSGKPRCCVSIGQFWSEESFCLYTDLAKTRLTGSAYSDLYILYLANLVRRRAKWDFWLNPRDHKSDKKSNMTYCFLGWYLPKYLGRWDNTQLSSNDGMWGQWSRMALLGSY